jgi:hypothetical protein
MSRRSEYKRKKAAAALSERQVSRQPQPQPVVPRLVGALSAIVAIFSAYFAFVVLLGPLPPESAQSTRRLVGIVKESQYEHRRSFLRRPGVNEFRLKLEDVDGRIILMGHLQSELETMPVRLPVGSTVELRVSPNLFGDYWLWQVRKDGIVVVRFADTLESALARMQLGVLAIVLLLVSASIYWKFRPESSTPRNRRPTRASS